MSSASMTNPYQELGGREGVLRVVERVYDLRCMDAALDEEQVPPATQAFVRQRFADVADFMRNVDEPG